MQDFDPRTAIDLSDQEQAADLSKEAIEQRAHEAKIRRVAGKARAMNRAFKGIERGGRRAHIRNAARREGLID